jgi:hypothetical protein
VPITISKSRFVAGVQCLKRLYLLVHEPGLAPQTDGANEAIIEQGREVGLLARQLFPGGVEVGSEGGLDQAIRVTRELIANPEVPAIFEAAFENGGVFVRADILHRRPDGRWYLFEVKSATGLKEEHLDDVGVQARVVSGCGIDLASSCLMHVNRTYVFLGGSIDARQFFRIRNLTRKIEKLQPKLTFQLHAEFTVLAMPKVPDLPPGPHCTHPVTCEFFDRCNSPRTDDHVGYLPRMHASAVDELAELGIESIHDIPEDFVLTERQRRACTSVQTGEPWFSTELGEALAALRYPLYFMDFESVNPAIPRFAGMRPYDQLPFQWSVHVLSERGAEPKHHGFLAIDTSDPRNDFIFSLCAALGESGNIVVYNAGFESQRLAELAAWLPQCAEQIDEIQSRLWDLLSVVRNHVYHPAFAGSFSLKYVLPALVPEMTHEGMEVANGTDAGLAWESLVQGELDEIDREKTQKAMLAYCELDTLAMLTLLEKLRLACE